jgi:hypothetical protein
MILESTDTRVRRGYDWLKTEGPALGLDVTKINLKTLDVTNIFDCPLAHASGGSFGTGMRLAGRGIDIEWATANGFMPTNGDFVVINSIWRDVIIADRNLAPVAA